MGKIKYYYNGKLVRTSNNEYKYGIAWDDKIVACCSRMDLAQKRLILEIQTNQNRIASNERFLREAKTTTEWDRCLEKWCAEESITRDQYLKKVEQRNEYLKSVEIKIVELQKQ